MAASKVVKRLINKPNSPSSARSSGHAIQKRQARVTVKYDRKELQKRLDVEKWIDERMEEMYKGREMDIPDEINIDELLDLDTDEQRRLSLQVLLKSCASNPEDFIGDLLCKLKGLQKQTMLRKNGLDVHNRDPIHEDA
ncbi:protein phosphatase 1 regulatory subunit 14A [Spea bombifrons]|uniref:protein phosphatase 1 regulatory subunit 14A n=1 Tax=Spea bombifrons TaxID=233779 RepID=UPI00234B6DC0|nr:protein phosphatase 1 regulatory subunit 14A [Spea bombifrons]